MLTRIFLCAILIGHIIPLQAQRNSEDVQVKTESLANAAIKSVKAETEGGNILVEGVANADARIEVYARGRGTSENVTQRFQDNYNLTIDAKNNTLTVSAKRKRRLPDNDQVSVSFRIYVPAAVSTDLNTSGGNIHCAHLTNGRQQVSTSGGNIAFDNVKGDVSGKTSGGNISINGCAETFDLFTSGGNIDLRNSKGKLELSTSGGNIHMDDLSGTIKAKTSGGNVTAERVNGSLITSSSGGNLALEELSCSLEASTSGGNLNVSVKKIGEYVKLSNHGSGHTRLELPAGAAINLRATGESVRLPNASAFNGDVSQRSVKGSLNGGGTPVDIDGGDSKVVVTMR